MRKSNSTTRRNKKIRRLINRFVVRRNWRKSQDVGKLVAERRAETTGRIVMLIILVVLIILVMIIMITVIICTPPKLGSAEKITPKKDHHQNRDHHHQYRNHPNTTKPGATITNPARKTRAESMKRKISIQVVR